MTPLNWAGRVLRRLGTGILRRRGIRGVWIDVGAHHGETTIGYASHNPGLTIYALEPNLRAAARMMGHAPNFIVIPMAVAEKDGAAEFHVNMHDAASSLLVLSDDAVRSFVGSEKLGIESIIVVPTVRLDTLMGLLGIESVDFLKVDAQGMDLAVVKSAGSRLRDIAKITLEVGVASAPCYSGAPSKEETVAFLDLAGFSLVGVEKQSQGLEENLTFLRRGSG